MKLLRKVIKLTGQAKLLKIYVGEAVQHQGKNVAQLIVNLLKENRIAGATVVRGVMGYGWDTKIHATKVLELSADLPMVIEAVDTAENIEKVLTKVLEILPRGLCFTTDVDVHFSGVKQKQMPDSRKK